MNTTAIAGAPPTRGNYLSRFVAKTLMSLFGWRIEADIPDLPKFVMVGAPHTSNWDFVLTMSTLFSLGVRISWLAKHSLFRWPFKGLMEWLGGIPVDRALEGGGLVKQVVGIFNSREKFIVAIMPAGTRSKVREWKTGFYRIALEAGVPIVLVRFDYGRKVMGIGPTIMPTGDMAQDIADIQAHYAQVVGKNP
jgi:1-acyl-sn-glycerol-3-phosphate acyltransferase